MAELKKIGIIGLGYVGLPLALEFTKKRQVVGYDVDKTRINELIAGNDSTNECAEDFVLANENVIFTDNPVALRDCKIKIVTVPTPINDKKEPDLGPLIKACKVVASQLASGDIVIFESTVYPGATEEVCVPIIENESGLAFNREFFCGYSPERINPGDTVMTLPKIVKVVSGSNNRIAQEVKQLYEEIITAGVWLAPSIKVAEASKVIENAQRDINIAFVNEISMIFEKIGIDTHEVLAAAGTKWNFLNFKPGLVGGHCIGVDPYYLIHKAQMHDHNPIFLRTARDVNEQMTEKTVALIGGALEKLGTKPEASSLLVLGVSFKANCPDIRNSKAVELVRGLMKRGIEVTCFDPLVRPKSFFESTGLKLTENLEGSHFNGIVVAAGHEVFIKMKPKQYLNLCHKDCKPLIADLNKSLTWSGFELHGFNLISL